MNKLQIARLAHEVNRAYCASLGDSTQPAWEDAPDWQRASAIAGVEMHLANPDATPEQSHDAWLEQKAADGWVYGKVKDAEKKEHPCFLPYEKLPPEQKAKDYLFRGVVHAAASMPQEQTGAGEQPAGAEPVHGTEVTYIGRRETHNDNLYDTGTWTKGQTKVVTPAKAAQMARHIDVFKRGATSASPIAAAAAAAVTEQEKPNEHEDEIARMDVLKAQVGTMNRAGLLEFAQSHYQQKLPGNLSAEETRAKVISLIDQYGPQ